MAVTQGHGNPDWTRDEIILALDLYFARAGQVPNPTDPAVVALSEEIRKLPIHVGATKRESFRNAAGVAFKLQNLRQVATGRGLPNTSKADKAAWADYGQDAAKVHALAAQIRQQIRDDAPLATEVEAIDDDEVFLEGRVLTATHQRRERRLKVRQKLLKARIAAGALSCEACDAGPKSSDSLLASSGFEAHHIVPLAAGGEKEIRLKDLALLCATCHRLIHRAIHVKRAWLSVPEFRKLLDV